MHLVLHILDIRNLCLNKNRHASFLTSQELERSDKFKCEEDRKRFIGGRILVRQFYSQTYGIQPEKISILISSKGKPYIENENFHFNISHSGDYVLAAFSNFSEVGVDIEKIKDIKELDGIMKLVFSLSETELFSSIENREDILRTFYTIWAKKESVIKALGEGFSLSPKTFSVSSADSGLENYMILGKHIALKPFSIDEKHVGAISLVSEETFEITMETFTDV